MVYRHKPSSSRQTGTWQPQMGNPPELQGIEGLLPQFWPDVSPAELSVERISHRRNADHWRVRRADETFVLRVTSRAASARRIIAALEALEGEPLAPRLLGSCLAATERYLIAMEDIAGPPPEAREVRERVGEFIAVIRRLHAHLTFRRAVQDVGRELSEDSSRDWAEEEWRVLQTLAPSDARVRRAAGWLQRTRSTAELKGLVSSLMVFGHGDLHRDNWRSSPGRLVLIDWEEVRHWPLASELADFIVFGGLDPLEVAEHYGAPKGYTIAVENEAAACALSFYLYWLRTLIDRTDPRPDALAHVEMMCHRLFES